MFSDTTTATVGASDGIESLPAGMTISGVMTTLTISLPTDTEGAASTFPTPRAVDRLRAECRAPD